MTDSEKTKVEFTPQALENLHKQVKRIIEIRHLYGEDSEQVKKAVWSFIFSLEAVLGLGGKIVAEDDLNLLGFSWIDYGMIWHRSRIKDEPVETGSWSVHS